MKEQIVKIMSQIELHKTQREEVMQAKKKEFLALQARVTAAIAEESKTREEAEFRLRKQVQEKALAVKAEIAKEA